MDGQDVYDPNPFAPPEAELASLPIAQAAAGEEDLPIAYFAPRVAGFLIDYVILMTLTMITGTIAVDWMLTLGPLDYLHQQQFEILQVLGLLSINPIYYALLECSPWQATVGKRVMGLKVVDLNGHRLTLLSACRHSLCRVLSYLTLCTGFFLPVLTKRRQTLHDILAGCLVIRDSQ